MQAFFLVTISLGNMLVALLAIATGSLVSQALQYFLFAGLMACAAVVFYLQTRNYQHRPPAPEPVEMEPLNVPESDDDEVINSEG